MTLCPLCPMGQGQEHSPKWGFQAGAEFTGLKFYFFLNAQTISVALLTRTAQEYLNNLCDGELITCKDAD